MLKQIQYFILFWIVISCIEPYEFAIKNNEPTLVVEAYISDKSFEETVDYPSDGRYFTVKLTTTGDVTNSRPQPVQEAQVHLANDEDEVWDYTESSPGVYSLFDDDFKAEAGVRYKLVVMLSDETIIESDWEYLPEVSVPAMGDINFKEEEFQKYIVEANEDVIVNAKGIRTEVTIAENISDQPIYYRWTFVPHWIYIAPFGSRLDVCWATDPYYIRNYTLLQHNKAGTLNVGLFLLETVRNERFFERFSTLIVQHAMREENYFFWKEMQEQNENGAIFNKPPFNLSTNFHSLTDDRRVSGYFGVVQEQAKRWYFDKSELSYYVENTLQKDCSVPFQDPAPECFACGAYSNGIVVSKPDWWMN